MLIASCYANESLYDLLKDSNWDIPADVGGTFPELAERHGFTTETHSTTTEDGYILVMHRITGVKGGQSNKGKPVVFF